MKKIFAIIPLILLTACGGKPDTPQVAQQPQPTPVVQQAPQQVVQQPPQQVIVQQAPQQSHDSGLLTGAVMGMALGHMMSGSSNNGGGATNVTRNTTVVNKTVVVQQAPKAVPPTPAPVARPAPVVQRTVVSSPSRSVSSGKR